MMKGGERWWTSTADRGPPISVSHWRLEQASLTSIFDRSSFHALIKLNLGLIPAFIFLKVNPSMIFYVDTIEAWLDIERVSSKESESDFQVRVRVRRLV